VIRIEEGKTTSLVALGIFLAIIGFIIYGVMANPYGRITALAGPCLIFLLTFLVAYGDYIPIILRGKQVNFSSGISGTLRGSLKEHAGGRVTGLVSIEKSLVPEDIIKTRRPGGIQYFLDWLTMGNVTIYVTGDKEQWVDIPSKDCDNRNGAINFIGNVRGELVQSSPETLVYKRLKNAQDINRYSVSALEHIRAQVANIASQKLMDMDASSQLLEHIGDRVKNVRIMAKRGGNEEAVASEMSSN